MAKLKPEIKEKLITALTDGSYKQGEGYLRIDGVDDATGENVTEFCCLGVLTDLAIKDGLDIDVVRDGAYTYYDKESCFLPEAVRDWAGTDLDGSGTWAVWKDESNVEFVDKNGSEQLENTLIGLNDSGMDFAFIANVIKEKF